MYVFPDVSGSMHSPVTGYRKGSTTAVRCIDVAALVAAAIVRNNPQAEVLPFESRVVRNCKLNSRDSVMTNAKRLASLPTGGTNCSAPLQYLNDRKKKGDLVIYVSDNESWIDSHNRGLYRSSSTETMKAWSQFKVQSPEAKMICIDIQPYGHSQAKERADITNVGGFNDRVFKLIAAIARTGNSEGFWVEMIERTSL